ncbi:MAG: hypothetical protein WC348_04485 [Patescibacteria group bacterium]|jgi:hypothetical protein
MDFVIKNIKENIVAVARDIGYVIIDTNGNEYNLVRKLAGENYPRFHTYVKSFGAVQNKLNYEFSLHLDQKKPSYKGSHAHSGEYFGPVVEAEADRIKELLSKN